MTKGSVQGFRSLTRLDHEELAIPADRDRAANIASDVQAALDLHRRGQRDQAAALYRRILQVDERQFEALHGLGVVALQEGRPAQAIDFLTKSIAVRSNSADAHYNLGLACDNLDESERAIAHYDIAVSLNPNHAKAYCNRGNSLKKVNRLLEARQSFERAFALDPGYDLACLQFGLVALVLGDFRAGWPAYESRWHLSDAGARKISGTWPEWQGEDLHSQRIIIYEEQGLGDIVMFSRFVSMLAERSARVTFVVRASMHRLLRPFRDQIALVTQLEPQEEFDYQCALSSLPGAFGTEIGSIPAPGSYLSAEPALCARWKDRLGPGGFKIGICWQGSPLGSIDQGRSFPVAHFAAISRIPGVRLISLQKNHGLDQLSQLPGGMQVETLGDDFDSGPDAFVDTAAVMANLDLIITSDTSIAHLAGALGRPVWVVLKQVPDWRWLLDRSDSPWYPSMKLYRQNVRGDWAEVFQRVAADVAVLTGQSRGDGMELQIPGSIGELFDKITILEIKAERISDPAKLINVRHELQLLQALAAESGSGNGREGELVAELRQVNEALWVIEDDIRDCERRQDFGADFIALARAVYNTNDRRAAIKKEINLMHGSAIIEEKSYAAKE